MLVSERAIGTDQNKKFVMVVDADNKAAYREVTLGASVDGLRVVTSGLQAGERIIVNGLQRVRPGALVAPQMVSMDGTAAVGAGTRTEHRATLTCAEPTHVSLMGRDMNLSKFFIDRPIFAGVLSVLIFLSGLLALRVMPISEYPEVAPPSVVVRAQYPGANPKVIAETVATPIEEAINGVEGMLYMSSQATTDGLMTLTVTFQLGTDPDKAQQLVQNRVSQAEPRLPEEVRRLGVTTIKSAPDLTMVVHLLSPNDRYDMTYLRNYAVLNVKDRLARIDGVGQVQLFGAGDYSMRVWLDPQKVAERGLSASDVVREIRAQNVQAAAGVVGASPGLPGLDLQLSINAQGRLQSEEEFGEIVVKTGANGEVTRLRDIARIELGASEYALRSLLDNKSAVAVPDLPGAGLERHRDLGQRARGHGRAEEEHAGRRRLPDRLRPDAVRARLDRGGRAHAARGRGAGRAGGHPVSCRPGAPRSFRCWRCRSRSSARSR